MPLLNSLNDQLMDTFRNRIYGLCDSGDYIQAERECRLFLNTSHGIVAGGAMLTGIAAHQVVSNESNDDWYSYFENSVNLSKIAIAIGLGVITAGATYIAANKEEVLRMLAIIKFFNNALKDVEIPVEYADLPVAWKLAYSGKWEKLCFLSDQLLYGINNSSHDFRKKILLYPSLTNAFPSVGEFRNKTILWMAAKAGQWDVVGNILGIYSWIDQNTDAGKANNNLDKLPAELDLNTAPDGDDPDAGTSVLWLLAKDGDYSLKVATALRMGADASLVPSTGPDAGMPVMWMAAQSENWFMVERIIMNVPYNGWAPQFGEFQNKTVLCFALEALNHCLLTNNHPRGEEFEKESFTNHLKFAALLLERGAQISEITAMDLVPIKDDKYLDIFFQFAPLELLKLYVEKNKITTSQLIKYAKSNADFSVVRLLVNNRELDILQNAITNGLNSEDLDAIVAMIRDSNDHNIFILSYCDTDDLKAIIKHNFDLELQSLPILQELTKLKDTLVIADYLAGSSDDEQLICQISHGRLLDPVSLPGLATDKFFERSSILRWIASKGADANNPLSPDRKITKASIIDPSPEQIERILIALRAELPGLREKSDLTPASPRSLKPN